MAEFVLIALDKPGALALRLATREAHLAHAASSEAVRIRLAGPFLDAQGEMIGSLLIIEADDLAAAQAFSAADPYVKAGLFQSLEIRPWRQTLPRP